MNITIKILLTSVFTLAILFQGCHNPTKTIEKYEEYSVSVINKNSSEISDFHLEMIGSDDSFDIKTVNKGEEAYRITFSLPVLEEVDGEKPISWGDYIGNYTQSGFVKEIAIFNYEHNFCSETTIIISGESYQVSFSD